MFSKESTYNLGAVLRETGLKADVLRAWERRYEMPCPGRSPGGHRLYSEYDIETIKWLRARQAEGIAISRAVELWNEISEKGGEPLVDYPPNKEAGLLVEEIPGGQIEALKSSWLEACLAFNGMKADAAINQAFALYPVETVCKEILLKSLGEIGQGWYEGRVTVQQEHFITGEVTRRLETLISAASVPHRKHSFVLACPPGERHTIPILLLALFLRRKGYEVVTLGADTPLEALQETALAINPHAVVMTAQQLESAASLKAAATSLGKRGIPVAFGGLVFNQTPALRERIPAYYLGESIEEGLNNLERMVSMPSKPEFKFEGNPEAEELAFLFRQNHVFIDLSVFGKFRQQGLDTEYIADANQFLTNTLAAAIELGDPGYVEAYLEWARRLLLNRDIPAKQFGTYLAAYGESVEDILGSAGTPIIQWIQAYISRSNLAQE